MIPPPIAATTSEKHFQELVIAYAHDLGWLVCHFVKSSPRAGQWVTHVQGDTGAPDLILARDGIVLLLELKGPRTPITPMQRRWARAAGGFGGIFRPADWPRLAAILAA